MPLDKVVDSAALDAVFSGIADAIRARNGTSGKIAPADMPAAIMGGDGSLGPELSEPAGIVANAYLSNGPETGYKGWSASGYIQVEAGSEYVVSAAAFVNGIQYCAFYDSGKALVRNMVAGDLCGSLHCGLVPPDNASYARFSGLALAIEKLSVRKVAA